MKTGYANLNTRLLLSNLGLQLYLALVVVVDLVDRLEAKTTI